MVRMKAKMMATTIMNPTVLTLGLIMLFLPV